MNHTNHALLLRASVYAVYSIHTIRIQAIIIYGCEVIPYEG